MRSDGKSSAIRAGYVLLAAAALANGGCLVVAAGAAVGGGVAGYAYYKGNVCRTFPARFEDVQAATRSSLKELNLAVLTESSSVGSFEFEGRTANGERIRIQIDTQPANPAAGPSTAVCVRVATFGDEQLSDRILDQVGSHLIPPGQTAASPPGSAPGPSQWAPAKPQTAPPPLLPEEAKKP